MSTFKKTKVVMLPTNEKAAMFINKKTPAIMQIGDNKVKNEFWAGQHLYFLSDEEIKEGDWYIHNQIKWLRVQQCVGTNLPMDSKKIIATTDKSLKNYGKGVDKIMNTFNDTFADYLPQPSQLFIEKFVEEYNKGNQITEVLVEYERDELVDDYVIEMYNLITYDTLKINPKNNTITIRKAKDSWSREEVKQLFDKMYALTDFVDINVIKVDFDKWIEENL